jgi:RNA polymerase sigma-70 factor, ECF subfamily
VVFQSERKWLRSPIERVGSLSDAALPPPSVPIDDESLIVRALQRRDEAAFESLLDRFYAPMLRLAWTYVRSRDEAEEVVQDTWLAVLSGIDRFERRSSLKTWIFRILVNRARTRAKREARSVPLSSLHSTSASSPMDDPSVDPYLAIGTHGGAGAPWAEPGALPQGPDEQLLAAEFHGQIDAAIHTLPRRQQEVITLRDVHGWSAEEVCELLEISDTNQRVLLHRARTKVREALAEYLRDSQRDDRFGRLPQH